MPLKMRITEAALDSVNKPIIDDTVWIQNIPDIIISHYTTPSNIRSEDHNLAKIKKYLLSPGNIWFKIF